MRPLRQGTPVTGALPSGGRARWLEPYGGDVDWRAEMWGQLVALHGRYSKALSWLQEDWWEEEALLETLCALAVLARRARRRWRRRPRGARLSATAERALPCPARVRRRRQQGVEAGCDARLLARGLRKSINFASLPHAKHPAAYRADGDMKALASELGAMGRYRERAARRGVDAARSRSGSEDGGSLASVSSLVDRTCGDRA